ncbi:hypothetical protein, partial [Enterovibrio norvegicus]|uniref:hypothetical protein n=1 Tax=Enterovibrio norvegicus TaxID=188144 RepID=UPI001A7E1404
IFKLFGYKQPEDAGFRNFEYIGAFSTSIPAPYISTSYIFIFYNFISYIPVNYIPASCDHDFYFSNLYITTASLLSSMSIFNPVVHASYILA